MTFVISAAAANIKDSCRRTSNPCCVASDSLLMVSRCPVDVLWCNWITVPFKRCDFLRSSGF